MRSAPRRLWLVSALPAVLGLVVALRVGAQGPRRVDIDFAPHGTVRWDRGTTPVLLVRPRRGDGWLTLARRYSGTTATGREVRRANPDLSDPVLDRPVRVPVALLRADLRLQVVRRLFPVDRRVELGWEHWVLDPFDNGEESWRWLAALFTGRGDSEDLLRRANEEMAAEGLRRAQPIVVPEAHLLEIFRRLEPVPSARLKPTRRVVAIGTPSATPGEVAVTPTPGQRSVGAGGALSFGRDADGDFALYQLRRGEALYSAVVVRFTGQLDAKQVNSMAMEIARRSGVEDVTSIPVAYPIKIPLDLLLPEHLPDQHPRRRQWEREQRELAHFVEVVRAVDLSGVHVVLDAGHGGQDSGAVTRGVWEASYAYDIYCRIKANLERHTRATVWVTVKDSSRGFSVPDRNRLQQDRDQVLLTRPPFALKDSVLGVHLRWYLTNDIILNRIGGNVPRSKTVFLSVHADSLHPSVRGAMVYVPSRYLRPDSYSPKLNALKSYREYRNNPRVVLSPTFKARSEASSRRLANTIITALHDNDIAVHPHQPVRDRVLRGRRSWVPAVLRYSLAQHAVMVECCNMANVEDRELLLSSEWREQFARSVVEGMAAAFSE